MVCASQGEHTVTHSFEFGTGKLERRKALALSAGLAMSGRSAAAAQAAPAMRALVSSDQLRTAYDFVVVGAGVVKPLIPPRHFE